MVKRPNYGIDGPKFVRNLFILAVLLYVIAIIFGEISDTSISAVIYSICAVVGTIFLIEGLLMILYVKKGKFRHRDRLLDLINWKGNETVLDVGTGLGLLAGYSGSY